MPKLRMHARCGGCYGGGYERSDRQKLTLVSTTSTRNVRFWMTPLLLSQTLKARGESHRQTLAVQSTKSVQSVGTGMMPVVLLQTEKTRERNNNTKNNNMKSNRTISILMSSLPVIITNIVGSKRIRTIRLTVLPTQPVIVCTCIVNDI